MAVLLLLFRADKYGCATNVLCR